jgi:hypothetical protein
MGNAPDESATPALSASPREWTQHASSGMRLRIFPNAGVAAKLQGSLHRRFDSFHPSVPPKLLHA